MKYIKGKVSVIIPTYKRSQTLSRAIKSVADQTYTNIEILVVDDNEPGDEYSKAVCELVQSLNFNNLILITQKKHINGAAARNVGIRNATGEYIAFLDDDDLWMPDKIEKQVSFLSKLNDSYGGVSTRKIYYLNGEQDHISEVWGYNENQNFDIISKRLNISTCTLLLKHECLDNSGYFDENLKRHQEVQLLAYFTDLYKVELINEILTVIDCTDVGNRPSAYNLLGLKKDYLKSIEPILNKYSLHKQRLAIAHNMIEVAWAYYRDGEKKKGLCILMKCFMHPSVTFSFFKRFIGKKKMKKLLKKYDSTILSKIKCYVNTFL